MSDFFKQMVSLSISGTFVMFFLFLLKPLYKNKLSKRWQYYIWVIVMMRFLIPFTPNTTIVGSLFQYIEGNIPEIKQNTTIDFKQQEMNKNNKFIDTDTENLNDIENLDDTMDLNDVDNINNAENLDNVSDLDNNTQQSKETNHINSNNKIDLFYYSLYFMWAAIAVILITRKITIYQSFIRYIKASRVEISDIDILNILAEEEEKIGIKRNIELYQNPLLSSPILIGFFRPAIILPNINIPKTELVYIMKHELIHCKRFDMFYKWITQIIICIHWFNPFVYFISKEINKNCELSCDEAVIYKLSSEERNLYGDTLIASLKTNGNYQNNLSSVTLTESTKQLKERLVAIMNFRKKSKITVMVTYMLTFVICITATAMGAYAATDKPETKKEVENDSVLNDSITNNITENDAAINHIKANGSIKNEIVPNIYIQSAYYEKPYIIELGWNIAKENVGAYKTKAKVVLEDKSTITVYFNEDVKKYAKDKKVLSAIGKLINNLNEETDKKSFSESIETPLISGISFVSSDNIEELAKEYYNDNKLSMFSAIFPSLDTTTKKEYCKLAYQENKIAFYSLIIKSMSNKVINVYAKKADKDENLAFFAVTIKYIDINVRNTYAKKFYESDRISFFKVVARNLTQEMRKEWISKASKDKKTNFLAVLKEINVEEDFD